MKITINILFLICLLFSACQTEIKEVQPSYNENDILVSYINDQWTFEGTNLMVFIHAMTGGEKVRFEKIKGPEWIAIQLKEKQVVIDINAPMESIGSYDVLIGIYKGKNKTFRHFNIQVQARPKSVVFIDTEMGNDNESGLLENKPIASLDQLYSMNIETDTLLVILNSGTYGSLKIHNNPYQELYFQPKDGDFAVFEGIHVDSCQNVTFRSLAILHDADTINVTNNNLKDASLVANVFIGENAKNITFENNHLFSDYFIKKWTFNDWKKRATSGIFNYGEHIRISNNLIENIFHGIENNGDDCQFDYNIVDRFSGDGVRNTANNSSFDYNTIKNALISDYSAPDGNHDDLFQAWTFGEPIRNVKVRHNIAIDYADKDLKLAADTIQGIACFDGFVIDWVIEDNLVVMDHPHGIALFGAENCTINSNTVVRNPFKRHIFESEPWIMVTSHKDGRPSFSSIVKNNLTTALRINDTTAIQENNVVMDTLYEQYFEDYSSWNFNKKEMKN